MAEGKRKKGNGIIFGLILMGASIMAIWQNEHRFDYHKAARDTAPAQTLESLSPEALFSHTGTMNQELVLEGQFVHAFQGYLRVDRVAEIYAWDKDEDDDGVSWSKEWMTNLQSNERNGGLKKKFNSRTFAPESYRVSDLNVQAKQIQFVDPRKSISPSQLSLSGKGKSEGLKLRKKYFYHDKGTSDKLGDERISYRGIPVPEVATYFGKWEGESAVAHQAEVKEGFIAGIIQDKGILHHLVAGERETALRSIKKHLARLKMIVRGIALAACTIGGGILFSGLTRFLVFIPIIGPLINRVTGWIGMLIGFLLGLTVLIAAYLASHPWILVGLGIVVIAALILITKTATSKRTQIRNNVATTLGHAPSSTELEELEFIQLCQLAISDGAISSDEKKCLEQWTRRNGWSQEKVDALTLRAEQENPHTNNKQKLESLIRYSLADGQIDRRELDMLHRAAKWIGLGKKDLRTLMTQVQAG